MSQGEVANIEVKPKMSVAAAVWDNFKTIIYALGIALVVRVLLFQPFTIPSESMVPTLLTHDYIFVNKYAYGYSKHSIPFSPPVISGRNFGKEPTRGDVIVFKLPSDNKTDYIKRLIGLPGDTVHVKGRRVFVNGKELPEERALVQLEGHRDDPDLPIAKTEPKPEGAWYRTYYDVDRSAGDDEFDITHGMKYGVSEPVKVPEGKYFVMGDSRDNSLDSRFPAYPKQGIGIVPQANLVGKATIVMFSPAQASSSCLWNISIPVTVVF